MNKNILKDSARDLIAFGSPVFFILAMARVSITENLSYLSQFVLAGILFLLLMILFAANYRAGLGIILLILISRYYNNLNFTIFAILIYICAIASLIYLKADKKEILKGFLFGIISAGIGYYAVKLIFKI